jgi:hypothetical protein
MNQDVRTSIEHERLSQADAGREPWRLWGPYLSDRQWGTVREDYSPQGTAWESFPHDHARSRAYRWGEDGIAGISDHRGRLCFALAFWNGNDPILKERFFGLTNGEGNHGEDVKEVYYYLDATPTHSYLKMLYKYPQRAFPYADLLEENRRRSKHDPEYELIDTGVFDDDRYFDIVIEYAKAGPKDILIQITVANRGPENAPIHVLPTVWFRNTWSWKALALPKPTLSLVEPGCIEAVHDRLGRYYLVDESHSNAWFCENETNTVRLFHQPMTSSAKDAFHDALIHQNWNALSANAVGTKATFLRHHVIPAGGQQTIRLRLSDQRADQPFADAGAILTRRRTEADTFYHQLQQTIQDPDARHVHRQALAGMIWSKQYYHFDVAQWLRGDDATRRPPEERRHGRNSQWTHLYNEDVISMPDKWEYPWYAAWDLAFHCVPLALVDPSFAKGQLLLLTREWYMHPNGQLPAYEWKFEDVNPPVHAWASWRVYQMDREKTGVGDIEFLERVFHKLMLNFTWWVNRKDAHGRNIFQGGFLGLDNISVFDRSAPLPGGGHINQADHTSWMAMYSLNLMRMALELALTNRVYEDIATKFFEHFLHIAEAMTNIGEVGIGLWDDEDKFFYDELQLPEDQIIPLKVRSLVGLAPLFAVEVIDFDMLERLPGFRRRLEWLLNHRPDLAKLVSRWQEPGQRETHLLSLLRGHRFKCLLRRMLDQTEFLSEFGIRSLSKIHEKQPFVLDCHGQRHTVEYWPAESRSYLYGGNSNWRGPIWLPMNYLIIDSLRRFHSYYGDDFKVECPVGSSQLLTIAEIADEIARRLGKIFLRDDDGLRPALGTCEKFQSDPHFRDHLLFHEYFHGDNGRGIGASHQTGWTGLVAELLASVPTNSRSAAHPETSDPLSESQPTRERSTTRPS